LKGEALQNLYFPLSFGGVGKGSLRGAKPLSRVSSPSPLKERGTQGVRLIKSSNREQK